MNVPRPLYVATELEEAAENLRRLETDYNAAFAAAQEAATELVRVQNEDTRGRGEALRTGGKPPAPRAPKVEKKLEEAEQHRDALREAVAQQETVIRELVADHPEWQADADRLAVEAREAAQKAIEAAAQACERVAHVERVRVFLENPDSRKGVSRWSPPLRALPAPNGDLYDLEAALAALRQALEPAPEPKVTLNQHGRPANVPLSQQIATGDVAA